MRTLSSRSARSCGSAQKGRIHHHGRMPGFAAAAEVGPDRRGGESTDRWQWSRLIWQHCRQQTRDGGARAERRAARRIYEGVMRIQDASPPTSGTRGRDALRSAVRCRNCRRHRAGDSPAQGDKFVKFDDRLVVDRGAAWWWL